MADSENQYKNYVKYLLLLRIIAIFGQIIVVTIVNFTLKIPLPIFHLSLIFIFMIIIMVITYLRFKFSVIRGQSEIFIHLLFDVLALSGILYYTGGSSNPFISLFILQVIIASIILNKIFAWSLVLLTISCYTILLYFYKPINYMEFYHIGLYFDLHVYGMWISFILVSTLVAYFIIKISNFLKEREKQLYEIRERMIKDENIIALGALAAGTAHELGTPLSIIALINKELEEEYSNIPEIIEKLEIINNQLNRCKSSLSTLSISGQELSAKGGSSLALNVYLNNLVNEWQKIYPKSEIKINFEGIDPVPIIITDRLLSQVIGSILVNAIQAARNLIKINVNWNENNLIILIEDDGQGIAKENLSSIGLPFFTTKENGKGLGIFLTKSVIGKLGGKFILENHKDGSRTCAIIEIPLSKIKI